MDFEGLYDDSKQIFNNFEEFKQKIKNIFKENIKDGHSLNLLKQIQETENISESKYYMIVI